MVQNANSVSIRAGENNNNNNTKLGTESMQGALLISTFCILSHQILIIHEVGPTTSPFLKISKLRHNHA